MAEYGPPLYGLTKDEFALATSSGPVADNAKRKNLLDTLNKRKKDWKRSQSQTSSKPSNPSTTTTSTTVEPSEETEWDPDGATSGETGTEDTTSPGTQKYVVYEESKFNEAYTLLRQMSLEDRLKTLELLRKKGFGSGTDVSPSGIAKADIYRYSELLILQDVSNLTLEETMGKVSSLKDAITTAATKRTPIKDVDSIFDEVMKRDLGRSATKDELVKFRSAYSGMEAGGNAPSLGSAAESQIKTANPEESKAAQFAGYAEAFENMLRGA
jgi:hypothetical protein